MKRLTLALSMILFCGTCPAIGQSAQDEIDKACTAGDYEVAEQLYRKELNSMRADSDGKSAQYAMALRGHAAVLKHLFNFTDAQTDEKEASRIEHELKNKVELLAPQAVSPQVVMPPPPPTAVKAAAAFAQKSTPAKSAAGLSCLRGEARYTVNTAIGKMDCHLMYDGKNLVRMMNEKDPRTQFAIIYPSLKTRVLEDESVNKGKVYNADFLACDAPVYIDEKGAIAAGAKPLGNRIIDGHPCSGWSSSHTDRSHQFLCEMWFAQDLHFPYSYSWAMQQTPNNKVTWQLAVFEKQPRDFVFDFSGYRDAGTTWSVDPWFKWMSR